MLYLLPNKRGIEVPGTIMKHLAPLIDPEAKILFGDEATAGNARKAIAELDPPYVFTTGHGIPCATTLQDNEPFVSLAVPEMNRQVCDRERNLDLWKGRVIHLHSCWCGKLLAPVLVSQFGAWAVFAHDDEFLFLLPRDGKTIDVIVAAPFLAEFTVDIAMLGGKTAGEAQERRMGAYDKWVDYFLNGPGSKLDGAAMIVRILLADKRISKLYGDETATVVKQGQEKAVRLSLPLEVEGGGEVSPALLLIPVGLLFLAEKG